MSKIKKTALIGVVGASALTAGYYTFIKPSIQTTPSNQKTQNTLTKKEIKNQKIQLIIHLLQQKKV
jgi:FMN-binding